jgi:uncharacterized LabA/DUF88 family protein
MQEALVLIDVSNMYHAFLHVHKGRLDYKYLRNALSSMYDVREIIAFGASAGDEADGFKTALHKLNISTVWKDVRTYTDPNGTAYQKGDWDVGIAVTAITKCERYNVIIWVTDDGDMADALDYTSFKGCINVVVGVNISNDLVLRAARHLKLDKTFCEGHERPRDPVMDELLSSFLKDKK